MPIFDLVRRYAEANGRRLQLVWCVLNEIGHHELSSDAEDVREILSSKPGDGGWLLVTFRDNPNGKPLPVWTHDMDALREWLNEVPDDAVTALNPESGSLLFSGGEDGIVFGPSLALDESPCVDDDEDDESGEESWVDSLLG